MGRFTRNIKTPPRYGEFRSTLIVVFVILSLFIMIMNVGMFQQRNPNDKKFWITLFIRNVIGIIALGVVIWGLYNSYSKPNEVVEI